jgi:hypothetical protein
MTECDCGARVAKTTHASWCGSREASFFGNPSLQQLAGGSFFANMKRTVDARLPEAYLAWIKVHTETKPLNTTGEPHGH